MEKVKGLNIDLNTISHIQSQIMGILVNEGLSAKEAIEVLDRAKEVYLSRSYHVNSKEKAD